MKTDYSDIIKSYPPVITLEQLYQICHISKRKAKWLLETGRIPCQDSGKKTRRFKIRTEDVVAYLIDKASNTEKYRAPVGMFNSSKNSRLLQDVNMQTRRFAVDANNYHIHISNLWRDLPDVLTVSDIQECTGLNRAKIAQWINNSDIEGIVMYAKYIVTKESLIRQIVRFTLHEPQRLTARLMDIALRYMGRHCE